MTKFRFEDLKIWQLAISIAAALNLTVCNVPVTLTSHTGSKVRLGRDSICMLKDLFEIALGVRRFP